MNEKGAPRAELRDSPIPLAAVAVLLASSGYVVRDAEPLLALALALCAAWCLWRLLPSQRSLILYDRGFEVCFLQGHYFYRWDEASRFFVWRYTTYVRCVPIRFRRAAFLLSEKSHQHRLTRAILGRVVIPLPGKFGMRAEDLTKELNRRRRAGLRQQNNRTTGANRQRGRSEGTAV